MAQKQEMDQMTEFDLKSLLASGIISSELEFQRASMADRSLRLLAEEDPSLNVVRKSLRELLRNYEEAHWSDVEAVTDEQLAESDAAGDLAFAELDFTTRRRELILTKLSEFGLKQKDLASLLSHSKSYTSELLNGIRPFSTKDLVLMHNLLSIDLKDLLFTMLSEEMKQKVNATLNQIAADNKNSKVAELTLSNK